MADGTCGITQRDWLVVELVGTGPGTCLDHGCGTGIAFPGLLERGWRVVGVDLSGDQLRIARQRADPPGAVLVAADASPASLQERQPGGGFLAHTGLTLDP